MISRILHLLLPHSLPRLDKELQYYLKEKNQLLEAKDCNKAADAARQNNVEDKEEEDDEEQQQLRAKLRRDQLEELQCTMSSTGLKLAEARSRLEVILEPQTEISEEQQLILENSKQTLIALGL
ncbi:MAG: hypothetical protein MHMPM18_003311 [Marteilia pararefringens]